VAEGRNGVRLGLAKYNQLLCIGSAYFLYLSVMIQDMFSRPIFASSFFLAKDSVLNADIQILVLLPKTTLDSVFVDSQEDFFSAGRVDQLTYQSRIFHERLLKSHPFFPSVSA
jgi:hypothetical protein